MLKLPWTWHRPSDEARERPRGAGAADADRRLPPPDLHGAFLRKADLSSTNLSGANFAGTDFTNANLRGSDLAHANLTGTILRGADLRDAKNLTWEQLSEAVIDDTTMLPGYLAGGAARRQSETDRQGQTS